MEKNMKILNKISFLIILLLGSTTVLGMNEERQKHVKTTLAALHVLDLTTNTTCESIIK